MSHELEFGQDGIAHFFAVGETAWHKEGHLLVEAPSFEEAIRLAGHDYTVEKRPVLYRCPTADGSDSYLKESAEAFVTVRTDTNAELGAVGPVYEVAQNIETWERAGIRGLVDSGLARLETGGTIREGRDAWLLMQWNLAKFGPAVQETFGEFGVVPFALAATNHSGRRGILFQLTGVRVVCANTLSMAEGEGAERLIVKHSAQVEARTVEAATALFGGVVAKFEVMAEHYRTLKARVLQEAEFKAAVLDIIAPDPTQDPKFNPEARKADSVIARVDEKRTVLTNLFHSGKGHTGDNSAWEAYNGVVEALDHNRDLWPSRAGCWRTASLMDGTLRQLKDATLNGLLALCEQTSSN